MADVSILNKSPVIGVLCVDIAFRLRDLYGSQYTSYLAASYVKFIEGGGGRVVPIWIGKDREYYQKIMHHLNGVLFPGGAVDFFEQNGFADAAKHIYEIAFEKNKNGIYMPILGICLGYEVLLYISAGCEEELRQDCNSFNISLPLIFNGNSSSSRLYGNASDELKRILSTENVTFNFHKYCITEDDLIKFKINKYWNILTTNSDEKVKDYISSVEHKKYPFYGLQFHPEKNAYEHKKQETSVPHSLEAVKSTNYFAQFFVNETRKNGNSFDNLNKHLIYNFSPTHVTAKGISWEQCYLFEKDTNYPDE